MPNSKAVAIISGGLDSSGVASFWKNEGFELYLLTFNYGQRAREEINRAIEMGKFLGAGDHKVIDISFMKELYGSSNVLTDETKVMPSSFQSNIIVPIRNAVFLTIATAYAFSIKAEVLAYGAHLSDYSYPDCRPAFSSKLAETLNLGDADAIEAKSHPPIRIWSPAAAGLKKDEMLKISYGLLKDLLFRTWSCYLDGNKQCGKCESCNNRKLAFRIAGIEDKTEYA
ncbi:MAG: 7-cyano-7-deazaguanine synthase [Nitrososphaerota archaeon]|nr:7-cyano-7-deazaguanine synthase [Nitrososphaerota archaeon]